MKIYTKKGDEGMTSLFSGGRVRKNAARVEAYGTVDELNSHLGVVRSMNPTQASVDGLEAVQNHLFRLGADLATPLDAKADWIVRIDDAPIQWLEENIDSLTEQLEPLKNFILPGGCPAAAHLHIARTVCRRAERVTVALGETEDINANAIIYLNRLSDWLFTLSRYENLRAGVPESRWVVNDDATNDS